MPGHPDLQAINDRESASGASTCSGYPGTRTLHLLEAAENYNNFLIGLIRNYASANEIMDFGAGIGTFARRLREEGFQVTCIEPDVLLRNRLQAQGLVAFEDLGSISDDSVDFIFSFNVLEHIADDRGALMQLSRKLKSSGRLLLYVPAFPMLWTTVDAQLSHHRRYTIRTLKETIQSSNFEVEEIRYADSIGFVVTLLFRMLRLGPERLNSHLLAIYDKWLFPLSRIIDLVAHKWFGKNVIAACRRLPNQSSK